ncbi:MAG: hypothetical protein WC307_07095 [Candidatus Nanoarchaeia archaeon]|jgi:hypothetical protein
MAQPLVFVRDNNGNYQCHSQYLNTVADTGSNGYDGSVSGALSVTGRGGANGRAMDFKANRSDYIDCTNGAGLNFTESDPITIGFTFKSSYSKSTPVTFISRYGDDDGGSYRGWEVLSDEPGNIKFLMVGDFTGGAWTDNAISVGTTRSDLFDDEYHTAVVAYTGSGSASGVSITVDSVVEGVSTLSDTLTGDVNNTNKTIIGARAGTSPNYTNFFEGELDSLSVSGPTNSLYEFNESPSARVINTSWDRIANDIGMGSFEIAGVSETNSDIRTQRDVYVVENDKLKWTGTIRDIEYSTYKIAKVTAKTWEVNLDDRKYYDSGSSSYAYDWSSTTSGDIIRGLLVSSDLTAGDIEDYQNSYNFSIRNDTVMHGVTKNAAITSFDFFVSRDSTGGEE